MTKKLNKDVDPSAVVTVNREMLNRKQSKSQISRAIRSQHN